MLAPLGHFAPPGSITDVSVEWPGFAEIWRVLTLQAGYNAAVVVAGAALLGLAAGVVGVFALLRKRALMGDALSHASLPGIALAFLVATWLGLEGRSLPVLLTGAAVTGVVGALTVLLIVRFSRLNEDVAIGAVLSVFFGAGVVLLSHIQRMQVGNQGGLSRFIMGQSAAMSLGDATLIGAIALTAIASALLFLKEFRLVCFDQDYAGSLGWPVLLIDLVMMALVTIVTVIGLQAVGLLLVVALIIIPPAAARFWTDRLGVMTALSGLIGALSGYLGATASALLPRLPTGAVIVLTAGALFILSMTAAPRRGFAARAIRHAGLRLTIANQHVLRAMYEASERSGDPAAPVPLAALVAARAWSESRLALLLRLLQWRGLLRRERDSIRLTPRGRADAARITRNHRLWEEYLVANAAIAPSHVDQSADMVEHILSPDLIRELEDALRSRGRLPAPADAAPPRSVHPIPLSPLDRASGEPAS